MKKLDFKIQDAKVTDLEQIRQLYTHYVKNTVTTLEEKIPDQDGVLEVFETVVSKDLPFIVAKLKDKILGYSYVLPYRKRSAYRYTLEDSIYIHPEYIGKGVGRALISEIMERCKKIGYKQIIAIVVADENQNSYNFHRAMGFEERGRLLKIGFKFGKWLDTIIMQKEI